MDQTNRKHKSQSNIRVPPRTNTSSNVLQRQLIATRRASTRTLHPHQRSIFACLLRLRIVVKGNASLVVVLLPAVGSIGIKIFLRNAPRRQPLLPIKVIHSRIVQHARLPPIEQALLALRRHIAHKNRLQEILRIIGIPRIGEHANLRILIQHRRVIAQAAQTEHVLRPCVPLGIVDMIAAMLAADAIALLAMAAIPGPQRAEANLASRSARARDEASQLLVEPLLPALRLLLGVENQPEGLVRVLRDDFAALHRVVAIIVHDYASIERDRKGNRARF